jgi:hypothetical protein
MQNEVFQKHYFYSSVHHTTHVPANDHFWLEVYVNYTAHIPITTVNTLSYCLDGREAKSYYVTGIQ